MSKQKSCHKYIYKINSKKLRKAGFNLTLPLYQAMEQSNDIVALSDSQLLRWILRINHQENLDEQVAEIRRDIRALKKLPRSKSTRHKIRQLYTKLYSLQYQQDYCCMIMNSNKDYDRANKGFSINGIKYSRLLGTNGGIKKSTITYINSQIVSEIRKRIDNGRDKSKPLVPAKLEAYQALVCSGSIPVTKPRIIVVPDCYTSFQEDVIVLDNQKTSEPEMSYVNDYKIEYCDSDGYGFMTPEYSAKINEELNGPKASGKTISGVNTRYAWTKGMIFTFDYVKFAELKNGGNYMVKDAWGDYRDVRDSDVILTTSMVKLWDSYPSYEEFDRNCVMNEYDFAVAKTMPDHLENARNANYQFLQDYDFTDEEIRELVQPTLDEIDGVLGGDYGKTLAFLKGMSVTEESLGHMDDDWIKALMIDESMLQDPFIMSKIYSMIRKRIQMASKGSIKLSGNFSIISGDLFALAQSMFGLSVTGLLKSGEVYHRYWLDRGVSEIVCFRAPMTCRNNIRKRRVAHNDEMDFWYQYNTTGLILNAWDSTCDATNGSDKDGDMFFTTDNPIIIRKTNNDPTIECIQSKAEKIIPTEESIIQANKLAFGDDIGSITNHITAMIERRSGFPKGSKEYQVLTYRIMCGQLLQQDSIDKAKGIISKPMPKEWYDRSSLRILPTDTQEDRDRKEFNASILADLKPYFMIYIYPDLKQEYDRYIKNSNKKCLREFRMTIPELLDKPNKTLREKEFLEYYKKFMPVGTNPCVVNRIADIFEKHFQGFLRNHRQHSQFDYACLKSNVPYTQYEYSKVYKIYQSYKQRVQSYCQESSAHRVDRSEASFQKSLMTEWFRNECIQICPDEKALCNIVLDITYTTNASKQFAWDVCGSTIISNLLDRYDGWTHYPLHVSDGDFEFNGEKFVLEHTQIRKE